MNRDYELDKRNYEQLVSRRDSAEMSGNLDTAGSMADFRLIDPPRSSSKPVAPNRWLLFPLGLLLAIAGGLFAAFAASQIRPVFFDSKSLLDATGLPVLGTVSLVPNEARRLKERASLRRFFFATGGLVLAYAFGLGLLTFLSQRTTGG